MGGSNLADDPGRALSKAHTGAGGGNKANLISAD
jgi:hypothetical protein